MAQRGKPTLGEAIRDARVKAGMTQGQIAAKAVIERTYLSLLENDRKAPTVPVLLKICKALGVKASDIIQRIE